MCITSTARRRSLTLQILPSHLLAGASAAPKGASQTAGAAPETLPSLPPLPPLKQAGKKKSKKASAASHLPHHDGLVVQHHYHDHAADLTIDPSLVKHKAKGGVLTPFPVKLHDMLDRIEADGLGHVVSWQPHGRSFVVHKPKEFVRHVMPHYFKQTKMASFQRQLNLYGFNRLTSGLDKGGYYHEMFLRGKVSLAYDIHRRRVKGTGVRLPTNPDDEPNFYVLPPVVKDSMDPTVVPPLPAPTVDANLDRRRDELLRQSHDHSRKIARAKRAQQQAQEPEDLVFFEGLPFHYLDPSALPPQPAEEAKMPALPAYPPKPAFNKSSSIVSASDQEHSSGSESDHDDAFLPSFSPSNMDWEGPLSSLGASFQRFTPAPRRLSQDVDDFFSGFDMPVDLYHEQIERMGDDDDTAFGYLLESAIE